MPAASTTGTTLKTPGPSPSLMSASIDQLSDRSAIERTKTITSGCAPYSQDDLKNLTNPDMSTLYEFFSAESLMSASINTIIVEGKFVNITYSAVRMSGDKVTLPEVGKIILMKLLIHTLEVNKVNTSRHLVCVTNLEFNIDESARLVCTAHVMHSDSMKTLMTVSVPLFDPGKAEDFD